MQPANFLISKIKYPNRFKPGTSGNPAGRPKTNRNALRAAAVARTKTEPAVIALFDIVLNPMSSQATKERAASTLLSIAWGRRRKIPEFDNLKMTPAEYAKRLQLQRLGFSNAGIDYFMGIQKSEARTAALEALPSVSLTQEAQEVVIKKSGLGEYVNSNRSAISEKQIAKSASPIDKYPNLAGI